MKHLKRLLSLTVICVLLLSVMPFNLIAANAAEVTSVDTGYLRPQPASNYYIKLYMPSGNSFTWSWSKSISVGNLHYYKVPRASSAQCEWAYCIDPDKLVADSYTPASISAYWNYLSPTQRTGMALAMRFGYQESVCDVPGYKATSNADKVAQYVATQMVIWEFKEGVRSSIISGRATVKNSSGAVMVMSDVYYNCVKGKAPEKYYNAIVTELQKYYKGPSFCGKTQGAAAASPINLAYDSERKIWTGTVTDTNNTGITAEDMKESLGADFTVERASGSNTYTISTVVPLKSAKTVYLPNYRTDVTTGRDNESLLVWANGTKQTLITGSNESAVNVYMSVQTEPLGVIKISKTGKTFTTTSDLGETIKPVFGETGLEDAVFDVIAADDIVAGNGKVVFAKGDVVQTIETDSDGKAATGRLYMGKYIVREVKVPSGFVAGEAYETSVELTPASSSASVTDFDLNLVNTNKKVQVNILKEMAVDETFGVGQGEEYKDVVFGVFAGETLTAKDDTVIEEDRMIGRVNVDENGQGVFNEELPFGKYYVKEIETNHNYVLDDEKYYFQFDPDSSDEEVAIINVNEGKPIVNEIQYFQADLTKTDAETGDLVDGASYGIWPAGEENLTEENAIAVEKTSGGQLTFDKLIRGDYLVKELQAPDGYLLDKEVMEVTVGQMSRARARTNTASLLTDDGRPKGKITILKLGKDKSPLSGAEFDIVAATDIKLPGSDTVLVAKGTKVDHLTSDEAGKAESKLLELGEYEVVETKAPDGYVLDKSHHLLTLSYEGQETDLITKDLTITNSPIEIVHTGDASNIMLYFCLLMMAGSGIAFANIFRRFS